jgi:outer membrane protein
MRVVAQCSACLRIWLWLDEAGGTLSASARISVSVLCVVAAGLIGMKACFAGVVRLPDALATAYETNPRLAQARTSLAALDQDVALANAGWRPSISASASYGFERGVIDGNSTPFNSHPLRADITVSESIYRGGRTYAEIERAIQLVRAGRAELYKTEEDVLVAATTAYLDVVRDVQIEQLSRENVRTLTEELTATRTQLAAGAVTKTDALQAEARLARARADEASATARLSASRAEYEAVIGTPPETLEAAPRIPGTPTSLQAALSIALSNHPSIVEARANARAADYAVDDAIGARLPQISVLAQYQYLIDAAGTNIFATKSPQHILNLLGQITIPLYRGGADEAVVRKSNDLREKATLDIVLSERNVRAEVESAWDAFASAQISVTANESQVAADRAAVEGVKEEQRGGERSVLDILNAQEELYTAGVSLAVAHHDLVASAYRLLAATGQLGARYLGLNVKYYDPKEHYDDNAGAWLGMGD